MTIMSLPTPPLPPDSYFETERFKTAIATLNTTRDAGEPGHWSERLAWEMSSVHSMLITMLERAYVFAEYAVDNHDLLNYLAFADMAFGQICTHHHFEETEVFPFWDEHVTDEFKGRLAINVEQHHAFTGPMDACWIYIRRCREAIPRAGRCPVPSPPEEIASIDISVHGLDASKPFNPRILRNVMDKFMPIATQHMVEEISTLTPDYFKSMGRRAFDEATEMVLKHVKAEDPNWFLTSSLAAFPLENGKELVKLPFFLRRILVPFVFSRRYRDCWKYCPYPENLTFAGSA